MLKSEISDDNTKFKYIRIHGETLSNVKAVFWEAYTDWDVATTSGTIVKRRISSAYYDYPTNNSTSYKNYIFTSTSTNTADQVKVCISSSTNHFVCDAVHGDSYNLVAGPSLLSEHTRNSLWDTVAAGYPPFVITSASLHVNNFTTTSSTLNFWWIKPEVPNGAGGVNSASTGSCHHAVLTPVGNTHDDTFNNSVKLNKAVTEANTLTEILIPFGCCNYNIRSQGGDMSAKSNLYLAHMDDPGNTGDVFVHNSENYRIMRFANSSGPTSGVYGNVVLLCKEA